MRLHERRSDQIPAGVQLVLGNTFSRILSRDAAEFSIGDGQPEQSLTALKPGIDNSVQIFTHNISTQIFRWFESWPRQQMGQHQGFEIFIRFSRRRHLRDQPIHPVPDGISMAAKGFGHGALVSTFLEP